ncbi:3-(methylthio)propionyl-CoA ligase [Iodidimonas sp. SYSU 1G8]|uniref:3-(methylthio)propionyl-CoA ligase n=1 Tax=Iodidimonas sp. SYSU 1G8 TaxID=3133967 RepID=UPI0031FEAE19
MFGQMQDVPLLVSSLIDYAEKFHGEREIVSRTVEGPIHRYTYADAGKRSRQLAKALLALGVKEGDRVGTLAWNTYRHFEAWYGITGMGAVTHTLNPRLFADQLAYIIDHAENRFILLDAMFTGMLEGILDRIPTVEGFIIMTERANMPATTLPNVLCYEDLIAGHDGEYQWPVLDEKAAAAMCYTSGTTGNPKGVLYTNRSCVLHALSAALPDVMGAGSNTTIMAVVPMFHANGWGIPHFAPMTGAKMVLPGKEMDGASIYQLLTEEKVTLTAAVPTVWLMLLAYLQENNLDLPHLERVVIGGSAAPRSMIETFETKYATSVNHIWGMTEINPIGSLGSPKAVMRGMDYQSQLDLKMKQGRAMWGVDLKITDDEGNKLPWDGKAAGHLMVRGPWTVSEYYRGEGGQILDEEGYFDTGDVANIDQYGYVQLTDRAKDVIKSGGEWISSIDLENTAVGHPEIAEAAVIGVVHPKWDERPLLVCVRAKGSAVTKQDVLDYMTGKVAKWWMPDDVVFVDELPHTATGKLLKTRLREDFKDYKLPTV